jgi:membrane associated rhomboid family serine protease
MNPTLSNSPATLALLILTTVVSLVAFMSPGLWRFLALEPYRMVREKEFHGIITSGFIHGGFLHLFVNMLVLFFFGPDLEFILGSTGFLGVYAGSLVIGSLYPLIKFRNKEDYIAIGASGAISGVVFSFCLFEPMRTIYLFGFFAMPAFLFAILYVGYSVYAMKRAEDNIGHEAHLAGALGGLAVTIIMRPNAISNLISQF